MKLPDGFPALPDFPPGEVWLAGAGPGDPRLLTVLALHAVANADTVVHDALVDPRILEMAREGAERIFAGKRGGRPSPQQAEINAILIERARAGRRVLRMKGGDPANPLGTHAMYLGSTLYRIHGSPDADSVGEAESSGCFRMRNADVADLYQRVPVGATVVVK